MKIPRSLLDQALETIQSLDPAGVGARNLSECLLLQLSRQKSPSPVVMDIVSRFLPELSRKHYGPIARELGLTTAEIQEAEKAIAALEPHPGRAFQQRSSQSTSGPTYSSWSWTGRSRWC